MECAREVTGVDTWGITRASAGQTNTVDEGPLSPICLENGHASTYKVQKTARSPSDREDFTDLIGIMPWFSPHYPPCKYFPCQKFLFSWWLPGGYLGLSTFIDCNGDFLQRTQCDARPWLCSRFAKFVTTDIRNASNNEKPLGCRLQAASSRLPKASIYELVSDSMDESHLVLCA